MAWYKVSYTHFLDVYIGLYLNILPKKKKKIITAIQQVATWKKNCFTFIKKKKNYPVIQFKLPYAIAEDRVAIAEACNGS